jgi:hypothetical protein
MWKIWLLVSSLLPAPQRAETARCSETTWSGLRSLRRAAFRGGGYGRVVELAHCEADVLRRIPAWIARPLDTDGTAASPCDPLDAVFIICNEYWHDRECAADALAQMRADGCDDDPATAAIYYKNESLHARSIEDYRGALTSLDAMAEVAGAQISATDPVQRESALDDLFAHVAQRAELAMLLRSPDILRESFDELTTLRGLIDPQRPPPMLADSLNLAAWAILLAREVDLPITRKDLQMANDLLLSALALYAEAPRENRARADNTRINLALAALQAGELRRAQAWITNIRPRGMEAEQRLWLSLVQVRLALAYGPGVETSTWQRQLDTIAAAGSVPMGAWYAAWTRGLTAEVEGRPAAAIQAYSAAEGLLEAHAHQQVDPGAADRHYLMFGRATRRLVSLLVAAGDVDAAVRVARHARSRAWRMTARETCRDAERGRDDRPPPGEVWLMYFRGAAASTVIDAADVADEWIGFAITADGVHAEKLATPAEMRGGGEPATRVAWSEAVLSPFRAEIDASSAIVVLATEALHALPFHELPWDDGILLEAVSVRYGLDLEGCGHTQQPPWRRALIVSGEQSDFKQEREGVARAMKMSGMPVDLLQPNTAAELGPLMTGDYSVAHIISHGRAATGELSSDDRLELSPQWALDSREILAATATPALVHLSACRASFADADTLGGGLGVAHAFLLRDTRYVVGPVEDLNEEAAREFAERFHRRLAAGSVDDAPEAWRSAYLDCRANCRPGLRRYLPMLRLYVR